MEKQTMYLKPNVVIEPLVDSWYAWPHLISPATYALNMVKRHMDIMESYVNNPEAHASAVLNPKMLGGPFMDFKSPKVEEVLGLMKDTRIQRGYLFDFVKAIRELNATLQSSAKGSSMEVLYQQVPPALKGYVELYYDLHNNPSFRFFEALLYKSKYYDDRSQSVAIWLTDNDHRPFCLSTPRLKDENAIHLDIPFKSAAIDELSKMKKVPQSIDYIKRMLKISNEDNELFETFFTTDVPPVYNKYTGEKIRMRYFGHACILVETKNVSILIDPLISYYGYDTDIEHFSDTDLPDKIDYVLITHNHQDHILFETLLPLRHKIKNIVVPSTKGGRLEDPELKLMLNHIGFKNVLELDEMETVCIDDTSITGVPFTGEHCDLNIQSKLCYHVKISEFSLLFMADSRIMEPAIYEHVQREIQNVDVIFLGMECDGAPLSWLYGPLMATRISKEQDTSRRLSGSDCNKGNYLVEIFRPKEVYIYAMGQEPWLEFISSIKYTDESNPIIQSDQLIKICTDNGILSERLFGEKEILYSKVSVESN